MVITLSINFEELMRVIVADNFSHTLKRAQRELNLRRTSAFSNYVLAALQDDHEYIVPPLIGNIDGDVVVTPSPEYPGFGTITIPMSAKITLFDGQHRNAGIMEVCRQFANLTSETVTLELSLNQPLLTQQQFFSDINGNASKPNAAINLAYDHTNALSQLVKGAVEGIGCLYTRTDFERTNITGKKGFWVSFKALSDASGRFVRLGEESDAAMVQGDLKDIWSAWVHFTGLDDAGCSDYSEYVREWLTFTAVLVNGFGFAVQELTEQMSVTELCARLREMAASHSRRERDDFFLYEKWKGLCVSHETGKVVTNIRGQRAAATRLVKAINAKSYTL
jgi:DNA sulfur modification protein DndB